MSDLIDAKEHAEAERYDKAWPLVRAAMEIEPDEPRAMCLASFMLEKQGNPALAYQICKRLVTLYPANPTAWLNLGKTCDTLWRMEEAENAYRRALNNLKAGDDDTKLVIFTNLAAMFLQQGKFNEARGYSERALKIDPTHLKSRHNHGLCLMAAGQWAKGWQQYEASVGSPQRIAYKYGDEPTWAGEPGKTVAIYGEQGLGDEICAASMYPDAIQRAGKVIIDCDARLQTLFARSFPKAKVYGTRSAKVLNWAEEDHQVDYSIAAMQLGSIFRSEGEFPRTPYLTADPDQVLMWKALWKSKGKPAVGIAWTGGLKQTASEARSITLDMLGPILGIDAHFVNLEYKAKPGLNVYPQVFASDYDQTAGLVASLDAVVSVPTSVAHLAGALGVPTIAMQARVSCWKYAAGLPFHPGTLVDNTVSWEQTINAAAAELDRILCNRSVSSSV